MRFRRNVGRGYGERWRGVIFDREYKNLDDLIGKSKRWFPHLAGPKATFLSSTSALKWVWDTGEELLFRQVKRATDYWNYHGQEFPFIGWNELTKYPTPELYDMLMSCNRTSFVPEIHTPRTKEGGYATPDGKPLPEMPLEIFATTNPYGPGHGWVKRRFIDPTEPGHIQRQETDVFNPRTQQREIVTRTSVHIFGSYRENKYLTPEYIASLENMTDENKRKAWLYGDWDIVAGGAFDDLWTPHIHIVPRFVIPKSWKIDRSFDWGSSAPFSVGWWAESNGEEARLLDGRKFCPPPGSLIRVAEWYGSQSIGTNTGLRLSSTAIAEGILAYEKKLLELGWIKTEPRPGPADNSITSVVDEASETIADKMSSAGVHWTPSDKSPGSRIVGLQLARDRLEAAIDNEGPALYFMDNCRAAIGILPTLPKDEDNPEDVDTEAEDHVWDEIRYRVLGSKRYASQVKKKETY